MPTLVATPGAQNANSYCDRVTADAYWDTVPSSYTTYITWQAASTTDKDRSLITATRVIDERYEWDGYPTFQYQNLDWPRQGMIARNRRDWLSDSIIPAELQYATAEFAGQLLVADRRADSDIQRLKITSIRAGPVSLSFDRLERGVINNPLPDAMMALIPEWWGVPRSSVVTERPLVRA
jgi:hypothetical protein